MASIADPITDFEPARLRPRHDGWTAERQRTFIATLAETGCISDACVAAGISPKSAYRLRAHPKAGAFVEAWDRALLVATGRLASIAFDRAIKGTTREMWKDGELVAEVRAPSDRMVMFLLSKLDARMAQVVELRYFAGMTEPEIAQALGITDRTVRRDWQQARLFLAEALK